MNFFRQSKIKVFLPKRSATAFTLVEILVTIVIIGILVDPTVVDPRVHSSPPLLSYKAG